MIFKIYEETLTKNVFLLNLAHESSMNFSVRVMNSIKVLAIGCKSLVECKSFIRCFLHK